ncbi:MAG: hypothetical protein J1F07_07640 [Muribaculaceae bacterium]|nr:hypothetical protein [Muribaculaceae bacterium]
MFITEARYPKINPKILAKSLIWFVKIAGLIIFATMLCMGVVDRNILAFTSFGLFAISIIAYLLFKKHPNDIFCLLSILPIIIGFILAIIVLSQVPTPPSDYTPTEYSYSW